MVCESCGGCGTFAATLRIVGALLPFALSASPLRALAQDNYEIQVYGSETVPALTTMVEVHSNFTLEGSTTGLNGVAPTNHALHETLEITQGVTSWFELGFYLFTSLPARSPYQWVGTHIRPRLQVPQSWNWPVGASVSAEVGYQRRLFSDATWSLELRPIVDRQIGRWYVSINPTLDKALDQGGEGGAVQFSPNVKVSYDVSPLVSVGVEYYGSLGPLAGFSRERDQEHQLFPAVDLNFSPDWEFNLGWGIGLTPGTDHMIAKMILGRRITW
jgi:hypothetical protein